MTCREPTARRYLRSISAAVSRGLRRAGTTTLSTVNGTYTFQANGTWTFDPKANLNNASGISAGFTYRIRDGDGDSSTTTQAITINDGAVAATPAPVTLDLNEAALSTAGATGSNPSLTSEVDNTPALSFTAGSDNLMSFAFSGIGGLVTDLNGTGGQDIFWQLVSPTQIKGFLDLAHDLLAVTLDLSAPASIAAGATGNVTVTATLSDNLQHVLGNGAQISSIGSVGVVATDTDGDTTTGTVNINVQDDVPTANSGPALTVIETDGVTSGTNLLANDVPGADAATTVTAVDFGLGGGFQAIAAAGTTTLSTVNGTYTFQANGTWTFDPNGNLNNASGISAGFTYRITDGDGDSSTAAQAITINDGAVAATPAPVTLDLNEAALSTAGATGSNPSLTSEVDNTPALSFTAGSDNLVSFAFTGIGGLVTDLNGTGGQDIFWQLVSPTQIKGFLDAGHDLLAVTLDLSAPASIAAGATGNVTVTATLSDNLQHVLGNGAQISSIGSVGVVATDTDGDTTTGTVNINVQDDVPSLTGATETKEVYEDLLPGGNPDTPANPAGASTVATGTLAALVSAGADQPGFFSWDDLGVDGLPSQNSSNGETVIGTTSASVAGGPLDTLTGYVESNGTLGFQAGERQVYTFVITDPATGAYTFTLMDQLDHDLGVDNFDDATLAIEFGVLLNYTDADGDSISLTGLVPIVVENDVPTPVSPQPAVLTNFAGVSFTGTLDVDGNVDNNIGADQPGTIGWPSILQGTDSGLTSNGQPIFYYIVGDVLFGTTGGGPNDGRVFSIALVHNQSGPDTYTVTMDARVDSVTKIEFTDGSYNFVGGNDPWAGFVPAGPPVDDNSSDLLLTPFGTATGINGNANSAGASGGGGGQNIGAGEGIRLDFVTDLAGNPAGSGGYYAGSPLFPNQDHTFDGHYLTSGTAIQFGDGRCDGNDGGAQGAPRS